MGDRFNMEIWVGGDANGKEKELFDFLEANDLARHDDEELGISPHLHFYCHDVPGDHLEELKNKLISLNLPYEHHIEAKWDMDSNLYYWHPGMESEGMILATQAADPVVTIEQLEWELTNHPAITLQEVIAKHKPPYLPGFLCCDIDSLYDDEQDEEQQEEKTFTIIGYYEDNGQRFCTHSDGKTWVEAVQQMILKTTPDSDLIIVEVIEGCHNGLTESDSVEAIVDFPAPDSDKPLTKKMLLQSLREEFEDHMDFGGKTWWREDLAQQFELTPEQLFDRDHDTGLLFELEQDGELSASWCKNHAGTYDYLVSLKGPRIEWE